MGLDIYFSKRNVHDDMQTYLNAEKRIDQIYSMSEEEFDKHKDELDVLNKIEDPRQDIAYFRKVNFLVEFFNYNNNCEYIRIQRSMVETLIERCEKVLASKELDENGKATKECERVCEDLLPTCVGFFFGEYDYNEYYFSQVEDVLAEFKRILDEIDWYDEIVEMICSW